MNTEATEKRMIAVNLTGRCPISKNGKGMIYISKCHSPSKSRLSYYYSCLSMLNWSLSTVPHKMLLLTHEFIETLTQ